MTGPHFRVKIVAVTAAAPTARSVSELSDTRAI